VLLFVWQPDQLTTWSFLLRAFRRRQARAISARDADETPGAGGPISIMRATRREIVARTGMRSVDLVVEGEEISLVIVRQS